MTPLSDAGPEGYYLHGWEKQFKFLSTKWEKVSQADRIAQVMWRGRTIDKEFPGRDALRRAASFAFQRHAFCESCMLAISHMSSFATAILSRIAWTHLKPINLWRNDL